MEEVRVSFVVEITGKRTIAALNECDRIWLTNRLREIVDEWASAYGNTNHIAFEQSKIAIQVLGEGETSDGFR